MIIATPEPQEVGEQMDAVLMNADGQMIHQRVKILREATESEWRAYADSVYAPAPVPRLFLYAVHMGCHFYYEILEEHGAVN